MVATELYIGDLRNPSKSEDFRCTTLDTVRVCYSHKLIVMTLLVHCKVAICGK